MNIYLCVSLYVKECKSKQFKKEQDLTGRYMHDFHVFAILSNHGNANGTIPIPNTRYYRHQGGKYQYWQEISIVSMLLNPRFHPISGSEVITG